jgi:hypothetical protein
MSWKNKTQQQRDRPTLDLHGYHLAPAIRCLTDFLETQQRKKSSGSSSDEALVITGSGSHSSKGPILRGAVEDLLTRRGIQFRRDTPGSILVFCQTGITFLEPATTALDTKVVVVESDHADAVYAIQGKRPARATSSLSSNNRTSSTVSVEGCPSLAEVVKEDADFEQGKSASLELARQSYKERRREEKELERAVGLSLHAETEDEQREEELFQQALALSAQQGAPRREEEEWELELLQQAISLSKQKENETSDHELLQQTIALSKLEDDWERDAERFLLHHALQESLSSNVDLVEDLSQLSEKFVSTGERL